MGTVTLYRTVDKADEKQSRQGSVGRMLAPTRLVPHFYRLIVTLSVSFEVAELAPAGRGRVTTSVGEGTGCYRVRPSLTLRVTIFGEKCGLAVKLARGHREPLCFELGTNTRTRNRLFFWQAGRLTCGAGVRKLAT